LYLADISVWFVLIVNISTSSFLLEYNYKPNLINIYVSLDWDI